MTLHERDFEQLYKYIISLQFENAQNSNLACWIEDLLRKPQIPDWLFIIMKIQQDGCLNVL